MGRQFFQKEGKDLNPLSSKNPEFLSYSKLETVTSFLKKIDRRQDRRKEVNHIFPQNISAQL